MMIMESGETFDAVPASTAVIGAVIVPASGMAMSSSSEYSSEGALAVAGVQKINPIGRAVPGVPVMVICPLAYPACFRVRPH